MPKIRHSYLLVELRGIANIHLEINISFPNIFSNFLEDRTISSSVPDVAYFRLTLVSLVSEPSLHFRKAWLLITISFLT